MSVRRLPSSRVAVFLLLSLSMGGVPASAQAPAPSRKPVPSDVEKDSAEIQAYRLTLPALKKIEQVYKSLDAMTTANPRLQEKLDRLAAAEGDAGPTTIAEAVAKLDAVPEIQKAIRSSGLTPREFVVFTVAFGTAGLGVYAVAEGQPLPPDMPPAVSANIRWFQDNRPEIDRVQAEMEKLEARHRPAASPR